MLMAGGMFTNRPKNTTGWYDPSTGRYCDLPPLQRWRHSVTGFTACGGTYDGGPSYTQMCVTFNISSGQWEKTHSIPPLSAHLSWKTSRGILLLGGWNNYIGFSMKTILLLPDGNTQDGPFDLVRPSGYSCAIEDPRSSSVIVLGGLCYKNGSIQYLTNVERYNETGHMESLPGLNNPRSGGCAGYYTSDGNLVIC